MPLVRDNIYEFSDDCINFLTNPDIKYDDIEEDDEKLESFMQR